MIHASCSPTTPRCRCFDPGRGQDPEQDGCGATPSMIVRGAAISPCGSLRVFRGPGARARIPPDTAQLQWRAPGRRLCRLQAAGRGSRRQRPPVRLAFSAGAARAAAHSTNSLSPPRRHWMRRDAGAHPPNSTRSRLRSGEIPPSIEGQIRPPLTKSTDRLPAALHAWLAGPRGAVSPRGPISPKAIRYALRHWPGTGGVPRRWPMSRDGHQRGRGERSGPTPSLARMRCFAGSDGGARRDWAVAMTLIQTARS